MKVWAARVLAVLGVVTLALPAVNCIFTSGLSARIATQPTIAKKPKAPANHYVAFKGTKRNTGATVRTDRLLHAPFRWTATLGYFDLRSPLLPEGESFGISLIDPQFVGAYAAVAMRTVAGVPQVYAEMNPSGGPAPNFVTLSVPGGFAEVQIEHTGTQFVVSARARGDANYTELARGDALVTGYQPSMDVGTLPKGTVIGFDDLRVPAAGRPAGLDAVATAREDAWRVCDTIFDALTPADGPDPDAPAALALMVEARDALDALFAVVEIPAKAQKKMIAARKKIAAAVDALTADTAPAKHFDVVFKAAMAAVKAADAIE